MTVKTVSGSTLSYLLTHSNNVPDLDHTDCNVYKCKETRLNQCTVDWIEVYSPDPFPLTFP